VLAGRAKLESAEQQLFLDTASAHLGALGDEAVDREVQEPDGIKFKAK
jgi:hypothetical protein